MRTGELARRAGMSQKAVRCYERLGPVVPGRQAMATSTTAKSHLGVLAGVPRPGRPRHHRAGPRRSPSVCGAGHAHSDDCPVAPAAYRDSTAQIDRVITSLAARRQRIVRKLEVGTLPAPLQRSYLR